MKLPKFFDVALIVAYKLLLDFSFLHYELPIYGGEPQYHTFGGMNDFKIVIGYLMAPVCLILYEGIAEYAVVTRFVMLIQMLVIVVPYFVLYGMEDLPTWHVALIMLGFVCVIVVNRLVPNLRVRSPGILLRRLLVYGMAAISAYVFIGLITMGGLGRLNFDFNKVYEFRDLDARYMLPGFGHFIPWVGYVFDMAWLVVALRSKKYFQVAVILALQILFFGMTNSKIFLFMPFVVAGLIMLTARMNIRRAALIGAPALIGICVLVEIAGSRIGLATLDRIFFVPAALHGLYFKYFSTHPLALMPGQAIGILFGSPYTQSSVYVIAEKYWGQMFSPNVGWIGDAYANFGVAGVAVYGVVLAVALKIADEFARKVARPGEAEGLIAGPAIALCSAALGTVLVTHGMIAAIVTLWVLSGYWSAKDRASPSETKQMPELNQSVSSGGR